MTNYILSILLCFLICFIFGAIDGQRCGINSEYSECACCHQHYCDSIFYNGGVDLNQCPSGCDKGCVCNDGFYYSTLTQQCSIAEKCAKPCCPANREYNECGTACPPTCDNPNPQICTDQCVSGCFCKGKLVEDGNGNCIPFEKCPIKCRPHEIVDSCVNPCQPTCLEPFKSACQNSVCQKGCVCRPPLLIDQATGKCVDKRFCEKQCPRPNEGYYKCTPCLKICGGNSRCLYNCVPGCQCKPEYMWHPIRKICVLPEHC